MYYPVLKKWPSWLIVSPWFIIGSALILAASVLILGLHNAKRESEFTAKLLTEKGAALISTLEGALRTGMGYQWADEVLQDLVEKVSAQQDIAYLVITNQEGKILVAGDPSLNGSTFLPPADIALLKPSSTLQWDLRSEKGIKVFQVYKLFIIEKSERLRHRHGRGHMGMRRMASNCRLLGSDSEEYANWIIFVGYDFSPLEEAQKADERHWFIMSALLFFLGGVGAMTLFLVKGYLRSRQVVQETTAFSSEIIRTLPVGIVAADADNLITSINPAAQVIMGARAGEMIGQDIKNALPSLWNLLADQIAQGKSVIEYEARCSFGENRRLPLALSASRILTEEGHFIGHALIMRDLGELRRLQTELRRRDRLAALGTMAAGIAHEIRNPLSAIKGLGHFFQESSPEGSEEAQIAKLMAQEINRLDKVVGDMLDFARPDTLNRTLVSLNEVVERAQKMAQPDMEARHVHFQMDVSESTLRVCLDFDRLTQALLNLFLNAVQAMPREGGKLSVRAYRVLETENETVYKNGGEEKLILEVKDTGEGIPADKLQDIFSPYFTTKARGTGLGLSIVHKIIEAHGGEIEVKSTLHVGTVFYLRFPLNDITAC